MVTALEADVGIVGETSRTVEVGEAISSRSVGDILGETSRTVEVGDAISSHRVVGNGALFTSGHTTVWLLLILNGFGIVFRVRSRMGRRTSFPFW
jgi:hypothetical protein